MTDFLDILALDCKSNIERGYYRLDRADRELRHEKLSLKENIIRCRKNAIIAEIKRSSPSKGQIRGELNAATIASEMERGGASGISVLTEPKHFKGSLQDLMLVRESVAIPILMKDFIVSRTQIDAASRIGADAILLIMTIFERNYSDCGLEDMIKYAHFRDMEVLLEVNNEEEFRGAVGSGADLVGINNRDLKTLAVDIRTTERILKIFYNHNLTVVSESGIESQSDVRLLRGAGARGFLIGTSVMSTSNVEQKVRELVEA